MNLAATTTSATHGAVGDDQRELGEHADRLRMAVGRLARLIRQQDPGEHGATVTAALFTLARCGPMTLGELAVKEHVAPPTMTKVVEKLLAAGFITRTTDAADRRVGRVTITEAGRRQLDDARHRRTVWLRGQLGELDPVDLRRVLDSIVVLERLTATPDPDPVAAAVGAAADELAVQW